MSRRSIGIDVGGTKILGVLLAEESATEPLKALRIPTPRGESAVLDGIVGVVRQLEESAGRVDGVGVGMPGLVERSGVFRYGPNLPDVIDVDVRARLRDRLGVDVAVENDATASCWAESQVGVARSVSNVAMATLGTGIGGGLIIDGNLVRGAHGFAGEPGHMLVEPNGERCVCGNLGCWEVYASGRGLAYLGRRAAAAGRGDRLIATAGGRVADITGEHVAGLFVGGDEEAQAIIVEFGGWVARGIANLVNVLDPEMVVVGGGVIDIGPAVLAPIRTAYRTLVVGGDHRPEVRIVAAELGSRAGAIGAALLGLDVR